MADVLIEINVETSEMCVLGFTSQPHHSPLRLRPTTTYSRKIYTVENLPKLWTMSALHTIFVSKVFPSISLSQVLLILLRIIFWLSLFFAMIFLNMYTGVVWTLFCVECLMSNFYGPQQLFTTIKSCQLDANVDVQFTKKHSFSWFIFRWRALDKIQRTLADFLCSKIHVISFLFWMYIVRPIKTSEFKWSA